MSRNLYVVLLTAVGFLTSAVVAVMVVCLLTTIINDKVVETIATECKMRTEK